MCITIQAIYSVVMQRPYVEILKSRNDGNWALEVPIVLAI